MYLLTLGGWAQHRAGPGSTYSLPIVLPNKLVSMPSQAAGGVACRWVDRPSASSIGKTKVETETDALSRLSETRHEN